MKKLFILTLPLFFTLLLTGLLKGESEQMKEQVNHGDYYLKNSTKNTLIIEAVTLDGDKAVLLQNKIKPGKKAHIYTFSEWTRITLFQDYSSDFQIQTPNPLSLSL
ncbi:MAG TPA: hypothetical protein DHW82_09600 [Spirochaetia bacterium]|nr:MAG: hypothetical protein A2Y41_01995 [Spirochaetes bacterium GWB1_36_13]HCL57245.1 hypothetical protein [Spirochaetia bacterium]